MTGSCGSCGADVGASSTFPWHDAEADCRDLAEPLEPVPPGHGELGPVSQPLRPPTEGNPPWEPAPLPRADGIPHCPACGYYHRPTDRCVRRETR